MLSAHHRWLRERVGAVALVTAFGCLVVGTVLSSCLQDGDRRPDPSQNAATPNGGAGGGAPADDFPSTDFSGAGGDGVFGQYLPPDDGGDAADEGDGDDAGDTVSDSDSEGGLSCPGWTPPVAPRNCSKSGGNGTCSATCTKQDIGTWQADCQDSHCTCSYEHVKLCECTDEPGACGACCPGMP